MHAQSLQAIKDHYGEIDGEIGIFNYITDDKENEDDEEYYVVQIPMSFKYEISKIIKINLTYTYS